MPILRTYSTRCSRCGWKGRVSLGDVRVGPWLRDDGTTFWRELVCPQCKEQVRNPFPDRDIPTERITPAEEEHYKKSPNPLALLTPVPTR